MSNLTPTVTRTWTCILFDLDGTLTDSAPGITTAISLTLAAMGRPIPSPEELVEYVGPPIMYSFRELAGMTEDEAKQAIEIYRSNVHDTGAFDNAVFPGIKGLLQRLNEAGIPLGVATSKPELRARTILDHFDLSQYFATISGASEDEVRSSKAEIVEEALRRLTGDGTDISQTVMVGDREYDVAGASANGIPTILVEWGYGSPAEADGAIAVVHSTDQLSSLLLG